MPEDDHVMTHGYVHGHIHHHADHMHIHGHIHNHDHQEPEACGDFKDLCNDILCENLDDCYFYDCENSEEPCEQIVHLEAGECCDDPACPAECADPACLEESTNHMCEQQKPKLHMFENLLANVQRGFGAPSDLQLHFPHPCHEEQVALENTHQLCFHAKAPLSLREERDFDFYVQFDNFPETYACQWEQCQKRVDDKTLVSHLLDNHIRDFGDEKLFQCEWSQCLYHNANLGELISHLELHKTPLRPVPLPMLTPALADELNITHMEILPRAPAANERFTCMWQVGQADGEPVVCRRQHLSAGELQHHLQDDHIGLGKPLYNCCWLGCDRNGGKHFVQRQKLFRHIHTHTHYRPCKCDVCGAAFAVPATLKQHMRTHLGEKPFACAVCGKRFTTSLLLLVHNRVHLGERPLECKWPGCGKRFSESSNLAKHMRLHSKQFRCECGAVFDKKAHYTRHRREHRHDKVGAVGL